MATLDLFKYWSQYGSGVARCFIITALYILAGILFYTNEESEDSWTVVDCIYFCVVTMSTVGYGDFSPSGPDLSTSRIFTLFWIGIGIVFVFSSIASSLGNAIIAPVFAKGRQVMEYWLPQEKVDLNGDGDYEYTKPRHWIIYYSKGLLPSWIFILILQSACAAVFLLFEDWSFGTAIYHCFVTATTVGYGDISIETDKGKLWASVHIVLSVSLLGELISTIDTMRDERKAAFTKIKALECQFSQALLDSMMQTAKTLRPHLVRDGLGLTELEFTLASLIELDILDIATVKPFIKKFRTFDVTGTGRLGKQDLVMMAKGETANQDRSGLGQAENVGDRSLSMSPIAGKNGKICPEHEDVKLKTEALE